jgi:general secretion pathway protein N
MTGARGWRRALGLGAGALLLYLLFLVVTLPAAWLADGVARLSRKAVQLQDPDGSVWSGSGRLVMAKGREFGLMKWSVNPLWLFAGRLHLNVQLSGGQAQGQGTVRVGYRSLTLKDVEAAVPAELAPALYSPAALIDPKGQIRLRTASLEASGKGLQGTAELTWQGAGARVGGANPLGDYRLDVNGQGENAQLTLATLNGRLQLNGQGQWQTTTGALRFQGSAAAAQPDPQLDLLLNLLGPDQGGGRRALNATLTLPLANVLLP